MEKEKIAGVELKKGMSVSFGPVPGLGEEKPEDLKHCCTDANPCPACLEKKARAALAGPLAVTASDFEHNSLFCHHRL